MDKAIEFAAKQVVKTLAAEINGTPAAKIINYDNAVKIVAAAIKTVWDAKK
jgi:prolyl-tRNA editing enzyme YbaK/EbsC (Cys-tRNA(Pro) deacylase)